MESKDVGFIIVIPIVILLHLSNNIIMLMRKKFHKIQYFILMNLSVSDLILVIVIWLQVMYSRNNIYIWVIRNMAFTASILSTMGMTCDRYIAVVYCLHYTRLATKNKLCLTLISLWITSFLLAIIPTLLTPDPEKLSLYSSCIHVPLYITCSVILVMSSLYIRRIRNVHEKNIKTRNVYFGVDAEKLGRLQTLKTSIVEIIRLNILTALLVIIGTISEVLYTYWLKQLYHPFIGFVLFMRALYLLSNPFVYMFTISALRNEYGHMCKCCIRSSASTVITLDEIPNHTNSNPSLTP